MENEIARIIKLKDGCEAVVIDYYKNNYRVYCFSGGFLGWKTIKHEDIDRTVTIVKDDGAMYNLAKKDTGIVADVEVLNRKKEMLEKEIKELQNEIGNKKFKKYQKNILEKIEDYDLSEKDIDRLIEINELYRD